MKILADENCEIEIIAELRALGHDVATIAEMAPSVDDDAVFSLARQQGRILLTNDKDFGLIAEHATIRPPAVVLMRLERVAPPSRVRIALRAIAQLGESMNGQFIVVEPNQLRSRPFEP